MKFVKWLLPLSVLLFGSWAVAQVTLPTLNLGFKTTENPAEVVTAIKLVLVMTVLTLAPAILIMMTGFTRILIVLSFYGKPWAFSKCRPINCLLAYLYF